MRLIEIKKMDNGAHNNQTINGANPETFAVPDGWAIMPDELAVPDTFPFVNIEVNAWASGDLYVTAMTANREAYDAAMAEQELEPAPEVDPVMQVYNELDAAYSAGYQEGVDNV